MSASAITQDHANNLIIDNIYHGNNIENGSILERMPDENYKYTVEWNGKTSQYKVNVKPNDFDRPVFAVKAFRNVKMFFARTPQANAQRMEEGLNKSVVKDFLVTHMPMLKVTEFQTREEKYDAYKATANRLRQECSVEDYREERRHHHPVVQGGRW